MGGRYHERWREDSPGKKFLKDQGTELLAWLSFLVPGHVDEVAVAAPKLEVRTQLGLADDLLDTAPQVGTYLVQLLGDAFPLVDVDHREHGRESPWLCPRCLREQEDAVYVVDITPQAHHLAAASQG